MSWLDEVNLKPYIVFCFILVVISRKLMKNGKPTFYFLLLLHEFLHIYGKCLFYFTPAFRLTPNDVTIRTSNFRIHEQMNVRNGIYAWFCGGRAQTNVGDTTWVKDPILMGQILNQRIGWSWKSANTYMNVGGALTYAPL